MKNFQTVVQELLHNHERQRRYIALLTALCMLMAFTVSIILIEPAESMTGELACGMAEHIHNENCFTYTCGLEDDESHVHSAECRKLTCEQTEHAHSENCYVQPEVAVVEKDEINQLMNADTSVVQDENLDGNLSEIDTNYVPILNSIALRSVPSVSESGWFTSVQKTPPDYAIPFPTVNSVTITVTKDGTKREYLSGETIDFSDNDSKVDNLEFNIKFQLSPGDISPEQPYIYYDLPEGITLPEDLFGGNRPVFIGGSSTPVGYYSISKEGLIVIRFKESYINDLNNGPGPVEGFVNFNASISRNNTADGDRTLKFGNGDIVFDVNFKDREAYGIEKNGHLNITESSDDRKLEVEWQITVHSYSDGYSFQDFDVFDDAFSRVDNVTINPEPAINDNYGEFKNGSDGKKYFHFSKDAPTDSVTFTFTELIDFETYRSDYGADFQMTLHNDATLSKTGDDTQKWTASADIELKNKPTITKIGVPDYQLKDAGYNKKIQWTVEVVHPYGTSLEGYKIVDDQFSKATDIVIKDQYGNDFTNFKHDGNTIEILSGEGDNATANRLTITYTTIVDGEFSNDGTDKLTQSNHVELLPPNSVNEDLKNEPVDSKDVTVTYENQQQMHDKTSIWNPITGKITWSVGAYVKSTGENISLEGYTMTDDAFTYLDFSQLSDEAITGMWQGSALTIAKKEKDSIEFSNGATLTKSGNTLTVSGNIQDFTLNYQTDPNDEKEDGTKKDTNIVTNSVSDKWGHSSQASSDVTPRDETIKELKKSAPALANGSEFYVDPNSENALQYRLSWEINMIKDSNFSSLKDTVTASVTDGSAKHYIDKSSIHLTARSSVNDTPVELQASDYSITYEPNSDEPTSFTITFNFGSDKNYHYVTITYDSIAFVNSPSELEFGEDGKLTFKFDNTATDAGTKSWGFTVKDETRIEKKDINVVKKWENMDGDDIPFEKIQFYLQRKLTNEDESKWVTIYKDGDTWKPITKDTPEEKYIYELSGDKNNYTWGPRKFEGLDKDTIAHDSDYEYRVQEVSLGTRKYSTRYVNNTSINEYQIINTKESNYEKYAVDMNGNQIENNGAISLDQVDRTNIGGKDYYVFNYVVDLYNKGQVVHLSDTFPEGFTFVANEDVPDSSKYHAKASYYIDGVLNGPYSMGNYGEPSGNDAYNYTSGSNVVNFYFKTGRTRITVYYSIKIEAEKLKEYVAGGEYPMKNSVKSEGGQPVSAEFSVTPSSLKEDNTLLNKIVNGTGDNGNIYAYKGKIEYSVFVNPEGKDISNDNEFDLVDLLNFTEWKNADGNPQSADNIQNKLKAGDIQVTVEKITDYSRDASGNITYSSVGTLKAGEEYQFNVDYDPRTASNKDDGAAKLTLTVPDSTPLRITYSYQVTGENGDLLDKNTLTAYNAVSLQTENIVANDSKTQTFDVSSDASVGITIDSNPTIVKYNIGNVGQNLGATFYVAQYQSDGWHFVNGYDTEEIHDNGASEAKTGNLFANLTYSDSAESGNAISSGAKEFAIAAGDLNYNIELTEGYLYKFVEIVAPEGYEAANSAIVAINDGITDKSKITPQEYTNLKELLEDYLENPDSFGTEEDKENRSPYYNLLHKFVNVHYVRYGTGNLTATPSDYNKLSVSNVQKYGTIGIPNNKLIDVKVSKTWAGDFIPEDASMQAELYWSYTKSSSGIPADAVSADAETLGLTALENPVTIKNVDPLAENEHLKSYEWKNLPNGIADRPIYYYVKEISYTVDEKTYKIKDNGIYQTDGGEYGQFDASYTNNGVNRDTNEISIRNAKGLWVTKLWRNSDNSEMTSGDIPVESVEFKLYGLLNGRKTELYKGSLTGPNWTMQIPESVDLTGYTTFEVEEIKDEVKLYGFSVDYNKNINGKTGELTIINKDTTPTTIKVKVNKKWLDNTTGSHSEITVKLYRSTTRQTDNGLALSSDENNLVPETAEITLNDFNNWTHTWTNLAYRDEAKNRYYYYAVESPVPVGYEVSYDRKESSNLQTIDITNYLSGDLTLSKEWLNADDSQVEDTADLPEISVELYRTTEDVETISGDFGLMSLESATPPSNLKVYAFGDSITFGEKSDVKYSDLLQNKLRESEYENAIVSNTSTSGLHIETIDENILSKLSNDYDVVLVIAGTNNLLHTNEDIDTELKERMQKLINDVFTKAPDTVLMIGEIPRNTSLWYSEREGYAGGDYFNQTQKNEWQKKWDDLIADYNDMLSKLVSENKKEHPNKIFYIDGIYEQTKDKLEDGVHPSAEGQEEIAKIFKSKIDEYYGLSSGNSGGTGTTPGDGNGEKVSGLPEDFFNSDGTVNAKYSLVSINGQSVFKFGSGNKWTLTEKLPQYDENGNEYHYYVRELTVNGYTTSYEGNGATANGSIKITNKAEPVTGLELQKIWSKHGDTELKPDQSVQGGKTDVIKVKLWKEYGDNAKRTPPNLYTPSEETNNSQKIDANIEIPNGGQFIYKFEEYGIKNKLGITNVKFVFDKLPDGIGIGCDNGSGGIDYSLTNNWSPISDATKFTEEFNSNIPTPLDLFAVNAYNGSVVLKEIIITYAATTPPPFDVTIDVGEDGGSTTQFIVGEEAQLKPNRTHKSVTYMSTNDDVVTIDGDTGRITAKKEGTAKISASCEGITKVFPIQVVATKECIKEIELKYVENSKGIWLPDTAVQEELKHLPMTDESGRKYLYYIEEIFEGDDTALQGYEKPRYFNDTKELKEGEGVELAEGSLVSLKVVNTRKESSTTTMPSTGGNGAGKCYTIGGMLMLLSACGWAMHRRKRVIPH